MTFRWCDSNQEGQKMIDAAARADWDIVLRDGSTLHVRAYEPEDADGAREFLRELSDESRAFRFFGLAPSERFTLESLDSRAPRYRYTLLAESKRHILALASYARATEVDAEAAAALVIADRVQGRGIGTRLLELLADVARAHDVSRFTARVLGGNTRMMEVLRQSGFPMECQEDDGDYMITIDLADAHRYRQRAYERTREAAAASMRRLFEPTTVAVVGAGRDRGGIGAEIFHNLRTTFTGRFYPVNPNATRVDGVTAYASVRHIPDAVDLAVLAVPCAHVPSVVDDCLAKDVRGLVVISAGFAEAGAEGRRLQDQVVARIRDAGIRLIGPNCLGILNTDPLVRLNATFSPVYPPAGGVAMATQSGALGLAILDYAQELNIGISSFASIGNKADVSSNDLIQYWAADPRTDVILLYLESLGNARTFGRLARHVGRAKPIVTLKAGRSRAGARAAASHTGALAASDVLADGLFRQAGVVRVETLAEMFDVAALLAHQPLPAGPRLGILTNAGGAGILAADAAESHGLAVPALSASTASALRALLPEAAAVSNPVDMLASASPPQYERALSVLLADPGIDGVLVLYVPPLVTDPSAVASAIAAGAARTKDKPVVATFMRTDDPPPALAPIPCYRFPEAGVLAMARATAYAQWRKRPEGAPMAAPDVDKAAVKMVLDGAWTRGTGWLTVEEVQALLAACRLPVAAAAVVRSQDEALRVAGEIGFPVALKAVGPTLLHKTDVGGVRLDLRDARELSAAYRDLAARLGDRLTGALVQRMVPAGIELLVGTTEDDTFGPVLLCSFGGTLVELFGKPIARLVPLMDTDVDELLHEIPGSALFHGYRGSLPIDERALRDLLARVSWLASSFPEILEMDLNPVRLLQSGLSVVDARIRIGHPPRPAPSRRVAY